MTATITPYRSRQQAGRDGFARLVHAEWTKFHTLRGWVIAVIAAIVLTDAFGLLVVNGGHIQCPQGSGAACLPSVPTGPGGEAVNDSYYFVGQQLAGNGSITAQVTSLTGKILPTSGGFIGPGQHPSTAMTNGLVPWAKAGIIITASTQQGAAYAAMMVTGSHGVRMQYDYTSDLAGLPGTVSAAAPRWLRLVRSGDTITGYDSANGHQWTQVGVTDLPGLTGTVQVGLFATSPLKFTPNFPYYGESGGGLTGSLATGSFDHVQLVGNGSGGWTGQNIGAGGGGYTGPLIGYRQAGSRYTVTGSGDIGPAVSGGANTNYDTVTIADHLLGVFIGLIILIVIAAMFITVEYRRGLINTTLAASPRRGRLLAAKATVIGLVTFAAGSAAAAIAVLVGKIISRDGGVYVLPVGAITEARVILGVGAMLAVTAILAMSIGTVLRRSVVTVAAVILALVLPYILGVAGILPAGAAQWMLRVTPAAAFAVEQSVPQYHQVIGQYGPPDYFPLAPWAGFAVLCGYAAVGLAVAAWLLRRRDA
jgi:ABC-type transport system involved in multi-copper enzyme maturation permease subunit